MQKKLQLWNLSLSREMKDLQHLGWGATEFWRRTWQPTPVFLPGESHGQRSLVGYSPRGHKELDMTEATQHTHQRIIRDHRPSIWWVPYLTLKRWGWHPFASWGSPDVKSLLPGSICSAPPPRLWPAPPSEGFHCEYEAVHISSVYLYRGGCVAKELWEKAERR